MHEVRGLKSVSLFVGTGECNANCAHCAGRIHRKYAPKKDGIVDYGLIYRTLKSCYEKGARSLSMSGSGEPTLSPLSITQTLELVKLCREDGQLYRPVNLYSNGIRIGEDEDFCERYLPLWRNLGLTTVYVTVHNISEAENAKVYDVKTYPSLEKIIFKIHRAGLLMRANMVLSKRTFATLADFVSSVDYLRKMGADCISAWQIRGDDDKINTRLAPPFEEIKKMGKWVDENKSFEGRVRVLGEKDRERYQSGQKLTLFPNGTLSNTWCN